MSGDKIVACIAIVGMLALVMPRLVRDPTPRQKLLRMAALWALILVVVTVVAITLT